jgi:hypothetical protein
MVCPSFGDAPVLSGTQLSSQTIACEEIILAERAGRKT